MGEAKRRKPFRSDQIDRENKFAGDLRPIEHEGCNAFIRKGWGGLNDLPAQIVNTPFQEEPMILTAWVIPKAVLGKIKTNDCVLTVVFQLEGQFNMSIRAVPATIIPDNKQ